MEIKEISHKSPSNRSFRNGIHRLLKQADARGGSADVIYHIAYVTHIASLRARQLLTSVSRSRT